MSSATPLDAALAEAIRITKEAAWDEGYNVCAVGGPKGCNHYSLPPSGCPECDVIGRERCSEHCGEAR